MAQLVDHLGRPIQSSRLLEEEAAPTLTGVRPHLSDHPSRGLTPQRLTAILTEAEEGDSTRFYELAEDMEEKDLNYLAQLGTRKRAIAQLEMTVEAAGESAEERKDADLVRDHLARLDAEDIVFDILDAIGKGVSVCELLWSTTADEWFIRDVVWRDPRWFAFDPKDGTTLRLREGAELRELSQYKYIVHKARAKSGLPIRGGLARAVSWIWLFKNFTVKDWVGFGEVFGQPYRVGKYHPSATESDKSKLLQAVASIGSDAAAIIPEGMMIEFIEVSRNGSLDLYDRMTQYFDAQITKAILGQTLTSDVAGSGSRALGEVHDRVRNDIKRSDARQLAGTLNEYFVRPVVTLNRGKRERYPRIRIGLPDELSIPEFVDAVSKLVPVGVQISQQEVLSRVGLSQPAEGEPVLGPPPSAPGRAEAAALLRAAHASAGADPADAIDDQVRRTIGDDGWEPVMAPMMEAVQALIQECSTLAEFAERLVELAGDGAETELANRLGDASFVSRLAGELGVEITDTAE